MEEDLKKKRKTNQSTKINLIGCDTIVNSPSLSNCEENEQKTSDSTLELSLLRNMRGTPMFPSSLSALRTKWALRVPEPTSCGNG